MSEPGRLFDDGASLGEARAWLREQAGDRGARCPCCTLIGHDNNAGCACGPTAEPVIRPDKSIGWVFTHHPLQRQETAS